MTTTRRPADVTVHQWQHQLIAQGRTSWLAAPRRSGLDKHLRRELQKKAWFTLKGHLQGEHEHRYLSPFLTYEQAEEMHATHHNPSTQGESK